MRKTLKSTIKSRLQPGLTSSFFPKRRQGARSLIRIGAAVLAISLQACASLLPDVQTGDQKSGQPSKMVPSIDLSNVKWQKFSSSQPNDNPLRIAIVAKDMVVGATRIAIKAPGNFALPTHWFTVQGSYTVLKGTFVFDGVDAQGHLSRTRYYPGDFATLPANYILRMSTEGTEDAILYLTLYGDWAPQLQPNPWNKPVLRGLR
jgi:hypothetical protein